MDDLVRAFYDVTFERDFLGRRGDSFQDLFASLMEARHPADFQRTRPWGNIGDRKNDGYIRSSKTLFQVYAPDELAAKATISKIDEDFREALAYWGTHVEKWVFVHNGRNGLGPPVLKHLLDLSRANPDKVIEHWGFAELSGQVQQLGLPGLQAIFGFAPTQRDVVRLGIADVQPLLKQIARLSSVSEPDVRPVPPEKVKWNLLSTGVATLLTAGMHRSDLVAQWFRSRGQVDPAFRDEVAAAFGAHYAGLRRAGRSPDEIFGDLQVFVGGSTRGTPSQEAAVLAVLAHFFETCDIFERPEGPSR